MRVLTPTLILLGFAGSAAAADIDITGLWETPSGGHVEIRDCGDGTPCGAIAKLSPGSAPDAQDTKNKDEALRTRPILGLDMLSGFERSGARWRGGRVYDPNSGNTYSGSIWLTDKGTVKLKGCIIWPACRTQEWNRVRD